MTFMLGIEEYSSAAELALRMGSILETMGQTTGELSMIILAYAGASKMYQEMALRYGLPLFIAALACSIFSRRSHLNGWSGLLSLLWLAPIPYLWFEYRISWSFNDQYYPPPGQVMLVWAIAGLAIIWGCNLVGRIVHRIRSSASLSSDLAPAFPVVPMERIPPAPSPTSSQES